MEQQNQNRRFNGPDRQQRRAASEAEQVEMLRKQLRRTLERSGLQVMHFCEIVGCGNEVARFRTTCDTCLANGRLPERRDRRKNLQLNPEQDWMEHKWRNDWK